MPLDDALALAGQVLADYEASGMESARGTERIWPGRLAHALRDLSAAAARQSRARSQAPDLVARHAGLLAAARASVAAAARGDADPAAWVRDVLARREQLPEPGASPAQVVADARSAMRLAGWTS